LRIQAAFSSDLAYRVINKQEQKSDYFLSRSWNVTLPPAGRVFKKSAKVFWKVRGRFQIVPGMVFVRSFYTFGGIHDSHDQINRVSTHLSQQQSVDCSLFLNGMNPFVGRSQEWLELELEKAQNAYSSGGLITSSTSGDVSVSRQPDIKSDTRVKQLLRALCRLDPEKYPPEECIPVTETRMTFWGRCRSW
jgi:hypothetical protein